MEEDDLLKKGMRVFGFAACLAALLLTPNFTLAADNVSANSAKNVSVGKNITPKKDVKIGDVKTKDVKENKKNDKVKADKSIENKSKESDVAVLQGSVSYSMADCIGFAMKNDPNIRIYEEAKKVQKGAVGVAKSNYFPTLLGGTGYNINNKSTFGDQSNSDNNNYYGLNVGVNQLIWDFGYTTARINMNKYNFEAAGYDLENAILNSIYTVKIAYTSVLAARANEDIYARSVRINDLNVRRTKAMYEVGLKSKIDLVNAEATLTDARINLINAQNAYQINLITLNNAMYYINAPEYSIKDTETFNFQKSYSVKNEVNIAYDRKNYDPSSVDAEIKDGAILTTGIEKRDILRTYSFKPFNYSMEDSIQKAWVSRPDLKALELAKRASEESLKAIKRSYYPAINASAGYTYSKRTDYGSNAVAAYAGIDFPSVNGMNIKCQIEQGKAYLNQAISNVDLHKKNIYFQVQTYYVNMKKLERTIPLMSKKVAETLENFELADGRYAVGLGNYIELQQAQTNYNNAQLAFVQSVFDYNEARFYLEKSMGLK